MNEKLLGDFLKKHNVRDKVFIASKCAFEIDWESGKPKGVTNSAKHIKEYIGTTESAKISATDSPLHTDRGHH